MTSVRSLFYRLLVHPKLLRDPDILTFLETHVDFVDKLLARIGESVGPRPVVLSKICNEEYGTHEYVFFVLFPAGEMDQSPQVWGVLDSVLEDYPEMTGLVSVSPVIGSTLLSSLPPAEGEEDACGV